MADGQAYTTDGYSFRFFSPEQIDQILRNGANRGPKGSHAAIERILKHEPGLERAHLWQRIRRLKFPSRKLVRQRSVWSPEDEKTLREGYEGGWRKKREVIHELLRRHPEWGPHVVWSRASKLGLVRRIPTKGRERTCMEWSEEDNQILLDYAGYKTARVISKMLHRSEAAVRSRLSFMGKSSRVHLEGFSRHALAKELHLGNTMIQRLIVEGLLEVRDPRITRESLDRLSESGHLAVLEPTGMPTTDQLARSTRNGSSHAPQETVKSSGTPAQPSRAKRVWKETALSLGVSENTVEQLIARGVLKLYDPRITEKSLRNFCKRHGGIIDADVLGRETRAWLQSTMDFVPRAGASAAHRLTPLRKHAGVVRRCKCGREIRGNVFFWHKKRCNRVNLQNA